MTKLDFEAKRVVLRMCFKGFSSKRAELHYKRKRSMTRQKGSGRRSKMTQDILRVVEAKMQADDETTMQHTTFRFTVYK